MLPHREWPSELSLMLSQCHGLWDEDDIADSGTDKEESDDELSLSRGRRASSDSLKSINLAASAESVHVSFPEQPTAIRRKRSGSSSQISPRSSFSSNRSKRGICHMISLGWKNSEFSGCSGASGSGSWAGAFTGCSQGDRCGDVRRKCFDITDSSSVRSSTV